MTSAPINEFAVMPSYHGSKKADSGMQSQAEEVYGSFQNAMAQAGGKECMPEDRETAISGVGSQRTMGAFSVKSDVNKIEAAEEAVQKRDVSKEAASEKTGSSEAAKETVEEAAEETTKDVVEKLSEELDVSEEDVVKAMEELGMNLMDLMDPSNMAALVTMLQGEGNSVNLLTDEGLYATIRQLAGVVSEMVNASAREVSEELGINMEQVLQIMEASMEESTVGDEMQTELLVELDGEISNDTAKASSEETNVQEDESNPRVISDTEALNAADNEEVFTKGNENQNQNMNNTEQSASMLNQMNQTQNTQQVEISMSEVPIHSYADANEIINQIGEYVKIHNSEGLSEMEIMLNPENLGNVHLQVASREGVITATITTQNETVQEALMVQAMTLKEELNAQGLKVEAVEVTIASHEFERDMHEGGEEAKELYERQVQKAGRRRLIVDGLAQAEELLADEELTDAERLQVDMMARSGNRIDFMA